VHTGDPFIYRTQYNQDPTATEGELFKETFWRHYDVLPLDLDTIRIYGDTAQKQKERNDFSVFQCWGRNREGIYLIDQVRGKWEAPQLESVLVDFYNKHKSTLYKPVGAQAVYIEDKSSGSSLIQSISQNYFIPIEGIQRHTDKVLRAWGCVGQFAAGNVYLPKNAVWLHDYKEEFRHFTPLMTHKFDDQIDPTMDAVEQLLVHDDILYTNRNLS